MAAIGETIFDILRKVLSSKVETSIHATTCMRSKLNLIARLILKLQVPFHAARLHAQQNRVRIKEVGKGNRRMPWLSKATKDAISCDKLRGGANDQ